METNFYNNRKEKILNKKNQMSREDARRRNVNMQKFKAAEKREYRFFAFMALFFGIAIILVSIYILSFVREIKVQGNQYSTSTEIIEWIEEDIFSINSIYLLIKYNFFSYDLQGKVEDIEVSMSAPWGVVIKVVDKEPVSGIFINDQYVYCDDEGMVILESRTQMEGVPLIEGIEIDDYNLFETMPVDNVDIFNNVLEVLVILEGLEYSIDTINSTGGASVSITVGEIEILLGVDNYQEKIFQIQPIMLNLENQIGVLDLSNFSETNSNVSFIPKEIEEEEVTENENTDVGEMEDGEGTIEGEESTTEGGEGSQESEEGSTESNNDDTGAMDNNTDSEDSNTDAEDSNIDAETERVPEGV